MPYTDRELAIGRTGLHRSGVPLKCCSNLISRKARFAKIFLLKTLVTFLMATPSPVWLLVAALYPVGPQGHESACLHLTTIDPAWSCRWAGPRGTVARSPAGAQHRPKSRQSLDHLVSSRGSRAPCRPGDVPDNTVSSLTKLLGHVVALIDDEFLIEDLEDLAAREVGHDGGGGGDDGGLLETRWGVCGVGSKSFAAISARGRER
jgi:hypothetical protein